MVSNMLIRLIAVALLEECQTGYAAQPLRELIMQPDEPPPVWPDPEGQVRGYEFSPSIQLGSPCL